MKNLITKLVFVTFLTVSFISCSKDDAPVSNDGPALKDDWSIEKYGYMDGSNSIVSENDWSSDCSTKKDFMLLSSSDTFTVNYFSSACESTFFAQENGTFTLNSTNDRVTISGGTDWDGTYDILTLTNTDLVLKRVMGVIGKTSKLGDVNFYKFSRRN